MLDLMFLTGIYDDGTIDWEMRSKVFEAEIERLNDKIESLGGKKAPYILSEKDKEKAKKIGEEIEKFKLMQV